MPATDRTALAALAAETLRLKALDAEYYAVPLAHARELHTGISGSGHTVWLVVTVAVDGSWRHTERFDTEAEAANWMKWA